MDIQIRNYRDFYFLFNQITENCFKRCANPCLNRVITPNEDLCIKNCTNKHVNTNHKIMELYMEIQPVLVRKKIEEMNNTQAATMAQSEDKQEVGIS